MLRPLARSVLVLIVVSILAGFQVRAQSQLAGIGSDVSVRRDGRGIPYIKAKNDADLYFIQGYETARDRLWQMDLMRRLARGETAELFGSLTLEQDKRWRRFGFAGVAEASLKVLSPQLRSALDDYARGVNAYISGLDPNTLPVEFTILQYRPRPWTAADSLVIGKILADALSTTWQNDLLRSQLSSFPKDKLADLTNQVTTSDVILFGSDNSKARTVGSVQPAHPTDSRIAALAERDAELRRSSLEMIGLYSAELAASNNWVISGKKTADGRPLLANDPHLAPTAPGIWYLASIESPGVHAAGVSIPGIPGIILGHNENIAWGATNVGPDVQDLYLESIDAATGKYKTPAGLETVRVRKEKINVRGSLLKPDTTAVEFDVLETRNGPVILTEGDKNYSLKWTALDPKNLEFEAFYGFNRAANWQQFQDALKTYGGATQNFVYADVKGNIGWYAAGRIPIRKTGDGSVPYDGSTDAGEWTGTIPFAELPHLYNPPSGLIVTANQRIVGTDYKYTQMKRDAASPWRARRIFDRLSGKDKLTMDDVRDAQLDVYNLPLSYFAKEAANSGALSAETQETLTGWDGKMTPDSRGALLVNELRNCVANKIAESNKPAPASIIRERVLLPAIQQNLKRWLPAGAADWKAVFAGCDGEVRADFGRRFGSDVAQWTWGKVFVSRFPHPLAAAPLIGGQFATPAVPIAGSGQTPNVGSSVSMRLIASPGNWDATRHVIPLGQSGSPSSPNFKDQLEMWRTGAPAVFPFSEKAVGDAAVATTVYRP